MKLRLIWQAWGDLFARHRAVWRHAWAQRADMAPPVREPHEAAFLPAALALQDTPVSPAPRVAMGLIVAFLLLALLWATVGHIDVVAVGQGKVVPSDRTKTLQPLEAATVQAIHVRDGQFVRAGDLLIELDPTTSQADSQRVEVEAVAATLQLARGQALLKALASGDPPTLPPTPDVPVDRRQEASRQLDGQWAEVATQRARLAADVTRREAEGRATQAQVRKLEQILPIATQRAQDYRRLVDQAFVSQHGYLEQEQSRIEMEADLAAQRNRLQEIEASLREVQAQQRALTAETRRATLDSIEQARQRLEALAQERIKAGVRGRLTRLVAPVDGTVQQLAVFTEGGVVTPAQPLLVIVPADQPLEVEAFFENKDIGFLHQGQDAEVKVETFQFTKYGTLHAELASVSHDAISDEQRGLIYASRVRMASTELDVDGARVRLSPGMAVTVEVKTGRRRVIEYFLAPLLQHSQESLRER
ncbi:MAG: HlyD family type I secretion periplasmic adaptor subunit [Hydrogenophaga sp.]|uniref:HlyD family type I secretion periplasmic adaptor subunit n=1 Tax=Hydrogenophaga sp. TaxID=1904254 RepID=UPI001D8A95EB|nr:HlyD family type I secretion periplasmic adaptor subunit [Hydrogenophaga sp.]MBX3611360.1 HlyD family type I secretion periplasmic adaptor subunit [Hydrogenophaga sp.]